MPSELTLQRRALKREACEILGIDRRKVRLLLLTRNDPQYIRGLFGRAQEPNTILTRPRTGLITYVHELLHLLYRRKSHDWVFGAAYILAGSPTRALPESIIAALLMRQSKEQLQAGARSQARKVGLA